MPVAPPHSWWPSNTTRCAGRGLGAMAAASCPAACRGHSNQARVHRRGCAPVCVEQCAVSAGGGTDTRTRPPSLLDSVLQMETRHEHAAELHQIDCHTSDRSVAAKVPPYSVKAQDHEKCSPRGERAIGTGWGDNCARVCEEGLRCLGSTSICRDYIKGSEHIIIKIGQGFEVGSLHLMMVLFRRQQRP